MNPTIWPSRLFRTGLCLWLMAAAVAQTFGQTNFITLAPDGAWTWFNDPRALFHNGVLYFGYVRNSDGRSVMSAFNPRTGTKTVLWASERTQRDDHFNPALLAKEDGTLLSMYSRHAWDPFFSLRFSTATNPVSPADWLPEQLSPKLEERVTYANPFQLSSEGGTIYNFCRSLNFNPVVLTSTNGGTNWSSPKNLIKTGTGEIRPYVKFCSDNSKRVDFIYTDGHPRDLSNSLYHAYYEKGKILHTDGTLLKKFSDIPLLHNEGERGTVVYQYSDAPTTDPNDHIQGGRAWCWDVALSSNGFPACVFIVQRDQVTGTNWFDDRIYYYYARWTGTNWQKRFIAQAGRPLYSPENDYAGGICIDPENPDVIYLSSNAEEPFNLSSLNNVPLQPGERYELYRGVTTNGGLSFTWTAVTKNSPADNLRPYVPPGHNGAPTVIWFRGDYSSFSAYNCAVVGLFSNTGPIDNEQAYETRLWRTEDGLPDNSVQAVTQTRDGYLWIGTRQGLVQFDGLNFKSVSELTNIPITALCEENNGTLWIGTDGAGVRQYRDGVFLPVGSGENSPDSQVKTIVALNKGSVLIGTTNGLARIRNGILINIFADAAVRSVCELENGNLLLATDHGLKLVTDNTVTDVGDAATTRAVIRGKTGQVWFGGRRGLEIYSDGHLSRPADTSAFVGQIVTTLYLDSRGTLWVGTSGGLSFLGKDSAFHEIRHEGESFDLVNSICEDREGNLWVGARDGLHRLNVKYFTTYTKQHGLANNEVTSVLQDVAGKIWIGTWGGGLHVMADGAISRIRSTNAFFNELVLGLAVDRNGAVWIGTDFDGGMFRYERGEFVRYWKSQGISTLADPAVRAIHVERRNRVWVGSRDALNVAFRGRPMERFTTTNGLVGDSVRVIFEDHSGDIWIGTSDGLSRFHNDQITNFTKKDGLSDNAVTALYEDAAGALWIGTASGGLNRMQNGLFNSYNMRRGLFSDEVLEIVEDNFKRLWMTCRSGVFWVAKEDIEALDADRIKTIRCVSYGKDDGLLGVSCSSIAKPAAWKSEDGRLWFATVKGLSVVDPRIVPDTHNERPAVVIQQILSSGKIFPATNHVKLPPGRGELEFHFTTLSFRGPERDRFKYKLDGVDKDWNDAGDRRFAHYNNIYPGEYHFQVQACNSDGVWNETGTTITFTLQPNFWQTWWFKLVVLAFALLLATAAYRMRVARIRELERLRLRIAADLHDEIGSSMGSISLLTRKIQKEGELDNLQKTDLAVISRLSVQAASSIRDIVWFVNPQYDTMQDLVSRMKDTASTMLGGIEVQFSGPDADLATKLSLDFRRNIFLMFKEILGNIATHSRATRVEIVIAKKKGAWEMTVDDNGIGFDEKTVRRGNGLENLKRRAEHLGGTLELRSRPGRGTTVAFSVNHL